MNNEQILRKIRSIKLCLMAHPDNTEDSEFADRISDMEELEEQLSKQSPPFSSGQQGVEDKNFDVRLKACIDKRMQAAGIFSKWLESYNDYDKFKEDKKAFFDSFNDVYVTDLYKGSLPPSPGS